MGILPLRVHELMGEIQRDKTAGQRDVLQQAERRGHNRRRVWARTHSLVDYHALYVKTDVALLADVFRNLCKEQYGLVHPAHCFTSPCLSWDALLKKTGTELGLGMHLFVETGFRGLISMVSKRYANAAGTGLWPQQTEKLHHVSRGEQPLRLGNKQTTPDEGF